MASVPASLAGLDDLLAPRRAVESRLGTLRRSVRMQLLLEGLAWTLDAAAVFAATTLAVDRLARFALVTRLSLDVIALAAIGYIVVQKLIRPLSVRLDDLDLAALVDKRQRGVAERIADVLQLPDLLGSGGISPTMVRAAVAEDASELDRTNFLATLDGRRPARFGAALTVAIAAPIAFVLMQPGIASIWAQRWLMASNIRWPQQTYLSLAGSLNDHMLVPRGEPVVLQVNATEKSVVVPDVISVSFRLPNGAAKHANFTRFGDNDFRYEFPPIQEPTPITITGGDDWLGPVLLEPIDRPAIDDLVVRVRDPGKSDADIRTFQAADAQILALKLSDLELRFTSRVPLETASLTAKQGTAPKLEQLDAQTFAARWTMQEALALEIQLVGKAGGLASKPTMLAIGLLKDREPRVTVRSSGVGPRVTPQARIPITLRAVDDFNLKDLALEQDRIVPSETKPEEDPKPIRVDVEPLAPEEVTEAERQTQISLKDSAPSPGTLIKLRGIAVDNCAEGSQTGVSRWISLRVVTPEELFHEILMRQRIERAKFRAAHATAKTQEEAMDTVATSEDVDGLNRRHQVVERQVWQIANRLDESLIEMQLNDLGTTQVIESLQSNVITPMRQLHDEPMVDLRRLLDRMASDRAGPEAHLPQALELQKQIVETMQKILEQMSQWESFVDVVNQLREVIKGETKVIDSTEDARKKRTEGVFDK